MSLNSVAVIGSGFAGLSAALNLARAGIEVDVYESSSRPGGRAQQLISPDGRFSFDMGPTLLVMTDVLRATLGKKAFDDLALRRLEPGYSVRWPSQQFDMHSDVALWLASIARFEKDAAASAISYLSKVHAQYRAARGAFLDHDWSPASALLRLPELFKLRPWALENLQDFTAQHFSHPRVREALTFQTLYLGLVPSRAPAIYSLLPVIEIVEGIWYARGGVSTVVQAFVNECGRQGVRFHFKNRAERIAISRRRADGIVVEGRLREHDAIVVAADREPALASLLDVPSVPRLSYGLSACVFYVGIGGEVALPHHTVLLPEEPQRAYEELDSGVLASAPPVYVCNPVVTDSSVSERGYSALTVLVPVPNRSTLRDIDTARVFSQAMHAIEHHTGPIRDRIEFQHVRAPAHFENELGLAFGAAFGPSHTMDQMGPFRPSIAMREARNVAFAGSGTRPGSGVALAITSGRLASEHLLKVCG